MAAQSAKEKAAWRRTAKSVAYGGGVVVGMAKSGVAAENISLLPLLTLFCHVVPVYSGAVAMSIFTSVDDIHHVCH